MKPSITCLGILALVFVAGTALAGVPGSPVPDAASTSALLAVSFIGLATLKRYFRR